MTADRPPNYRDRIACDTCKHGDDKHCYYDEYLIFCKKHCYLANAYMVCDDYEQN